MDATTQLALQSNRSPVQTTPPFGTTLPSVTQNHARQTSPNVTNWLETALYYHRLTGSPVLFIGSWGNGKQPYPTLYKSNTRDKETGEWIPGWEQFQQGQTEADLIAYWESINQSQVIAIGLIHLGTGCLDFDQIPPDLFPKIEAVINEAVKVGLINRAWIESYQRNPDNKNHSIHVWYTPQEGERFEVVHFVDGGKGEVRGDRGHQTLVHGQHKKSGTRYHFITNTLPTEKPPTLTDAQIDAILAAVGIVKKTPRPVVTTLPDGNQISPYDYLSDKAYQTILSELHAAIVRRGDDPKKLHCPNPSHEDKNHSAYVMTHEGNTKRGEIFCSGCDALVKLDYSCQAYGVDYAGIQKRYPTGTKTGASIVLTSPHPTPPRELGSNPVLPNKSGAVPPADTGAAHVPTQGDTITAQFIGQAGIELVSKITVIKSPVGTGKTEFVNSILQQHNPPRVLFITHRTSLNRNLTARFEAMGFVSHLDTGAPGSAPKLVITADSLPKLRGKDNSLPEYDLIVLDECEQQFKHMLGDTFKGLESQEALNMYIALVRKSGRAVLMDAHADSLTRLFLQLCGLQSSATRWVINTYRRADLPTAYFYPKRKFLLGKIQEELRAGKKVLVGTDSIKQAKKLGSVFAEYHPLVIHAQNSQTEAVQAKLRDINQTVADHQLIIYSPAIGSGLDIQTPVDSVFGYYVGNVLTAPECVQQLGRARHVTGGVHLYMPNDRTPDKHAITDSDTLIIGEMDIYARRYAGLSTVQFDTDGNPLPPQAIFGDLPPVVRNHLTLWGTATAKDNALMNCQKSALIDVLKGEGYSIDILEENALGAVDSALLATAVEVSEQLAETEKQATIEAAPVSENLYRSRQMAGRVELSDVYGYERWKIEETYKQEISADLYTEYEKWGKHGELGRYLWLLQNEKTLARKDSDETAAALGDGILSPARQKNRVMTRRLILYLISQALGLPERITLDGKAAALQFEPKTLARFERYARAKELDLKRLLGINPKSYKTPAGLLRALLQTVGLDLTTERTRNEQGERETHYSLDWERLTAMAEHTRAYAEAEGLDLGEGFLSIPRAYAPGVKGEAAK